MPETSPEKSSDFNYFIINNNADEITPKIYVANPTPDEYKNLGQLFLVAEIRNQHPKNQEIIEALLSSLRHAYYAQKEAHDIEIAFENTLATVNKDLREYLVDLPPEWFGEFNIIIGALLNQKLVFTHLGKINSLLILNNTISNLSEATNDELSPLKIFTNVSAGELPGGSKIMVCNENVLDYFSLEKIRKTLVENDLATALEYFNRLLDEQNVSTNFLSLGFQSMQNKNSVSQTIPTDISPQKTEITFEEKVETSIQTQLANDQDSMTELIAKESKTESYLTPSYWPSVKKFASSLFNKKKNDYSKFKNSADKIQRHNTTNQLASTAGSVLSKSKDIIVNLFGKFNKKSNFPKKNIKSSFSNLPQKTNSSFNRLISKITHLSAPRKILLILAILLIVLFTWSVTGLGERKESQTQQAEIEKTLTTVETKINEAKAALLYDNEEGSRELLVEAGDLLETVPNTKNWLEEKDTKQSAIDEQYKAIAHVKTIENPEEITNFSSLDSAQAIGKIFSLEENIYAFNATNEQIYSLTLGDKNLETVYDSTQGTSIKAIDDLTTNRLVSVANGNIINQFDILTNELTPLEIDLSGINGSIVDINSFSNRLYALVPQDQQIYRHTANNGNYASGENWLAPGMERISQAVSMAIDGSVYLLFTDGKVEKYSAGQKDNDFSVSSLEPSLENATKLYTDETLDNLYILDPNNKRLVVFTKNGKLVQQYFSEKFSSLTDFTIDEQNKTAHLINGTQLYRIDLE